MASGFLENLEGVVVSADAQSAVTDWGRVTLDTSDNLPLPTGMVRWSHVEVVLTDNANGAGDETCRIFLSWDSAGEDICFRPTADAKMIVIGTSQRHLATFSLDICPTLPPDGEASKIYLWVHVSNFNDATPVCNRARLHWHDIGKG